MRYRFRVLEYLLLALAVVIALGQVVGRLFRFVGQPPVIGEVVAGILLGPSLLGWLWPKAYAFILPTSVAPLLGAVAQLGVILYMFLVGLELNPARLRRQFGTTVAISNTGIIVPFVLGVALAFYLYPQVSSNAVPFLNFTLFVGVAMSITAFPVLARILANLRLTHTRAALGPPQSPPPEEHQGRRATRPPNGPRPRRRARAARPAPIGPVGPSAPARPAAGPGRSTRPAGASVGHRAVPRAGRGGRAIGSSRSARSRARPSEGTSPCSAGLW
jgi:hypothetical protein